MKKMNGVKFDWTNNTITMNLKFTKEASIPGTPEHKFVKSLREEYPDFTVISASAREKKSARPDKGLTFEKMALYISTFKNADELLEIFETVKIRAKVTASSKKYVTDWFKAQFPNYNTAIVTDPSKLIVMPIAIPDTANYKPKTQELPEVAEG